MHDTQMITVRTAPVRPMIDMTIPAVAIPVGAPTSTAFFLPMIPRIKPTIAVATPTYGTTSEHMPNTIAAIDIPLPGYDPGFCGG